MTSLPSSCVIGTHEMNLAQTEDVNGKRTGKMFKGSVNCWMCLVKWYLPVYLFSRCYMSFILVHRSTFLVNTGREYLNHHCKLGNTERPLTRTYGATGELGQDLLQFTVLTRPFRRCWSREVKFGALLNRMLARKMDWLATGRSFTIVATSRQNQGRRQFSSQQVITLV